MTQVRRLLRLSLVAAVAITGCATMSPEQEAREAIWWDAARECEGRFATIKVQRIDSYGRLWLGLTQGASYEVDAFNQCWNQGVRERTGKAGQKQK